MSSQEAQYYLKRIRLRYVTLRLIEAVLLSLAAGFIILIFSGFLSIAPPTNFIISGVAGLIVLIGRSIQLGLFGISDKLIANYLNRRYTDLEESVDLLIRSKEDLSILQQIQQLRAIHKLEAIKAHVQLPHRIGTAFIILGLSLGILMLIQTFVFPIGSSSIPSNAGKHQTPLTAMKNETVTLHGSTIDITPPSYTNLKPARTKNFNLSLAEGSEVTWTIDFTGEVSSSYLILSGKDTLKFSSSDTNRYSTHRKFTEPAFYQIQWRDKHHQLKSTEFYKIDLVTDAPPKIVVESPQQFTELSFSGDLTVPLKATLTDDYGLRDSYIIATVSKGSGESVKFREEKLRFSHPARFDGQVAKAERLIDLRKLGMEPGDELYFYIEALDNKMPASNRARTETYFVSLQDTAADNFGVDAGLGVDLMPEYFRSQRQIIIDSEKLLEEQKRNKVTVENFKSRSNELGYDQKVLRLRYGQFMGEEFETGGFHLETEDDKEEKDEDIQKKYGHTHDTQNEHNLVADKTVADHAKATAEKSAGGKAGADTEFLGLSIRAKLRAALTLMWDAELHLRLFDPARSLPFQYKILKLLKEISNDSRVYVRRTGFDPPPLKEDKRLGGDLTEIRNSSAAFKPEKNITYPAIRIALSELEILLQTDTVRISQQQKEIFSQAGNELAAVALANPGSYLHSLSLLKALVNNEIKTENIKPELLKIRASFWKVLPPQIASPAQQRLTPHTLDDAFLKQLENLKHE